MSVKKPVKVNLGCGTNLVKGWVNIDTVRPENADDKFVLGSALDIPLEKNSVDYLLMDQVLEHLPMADIVPCLYEVRRVLKVGGRAVIIVPDFEGAVDQWKAANLNPFFDPMKFRYFSEVIYGNQAHAGEFHQTPMCAGLLHYSLNTVGLTKHQIVFWPAFGVCPEFPGVRPIRTNAVLRNAQLVADITKLV